MSVDDETPDWAAMEAEAEAMGDDPGQMPGEPLRDPDMLYSPLNEPRYSDPEREADRQRRVRVTLDWHARQAAESAAYEQAREELAARRGPLYREGLPGLQPVNAEEVWPPNDESRQARRERLEWGRTGQGIGRWWIRFIYWKNFRVEARVLGGPDEARVDIDFEVTTRYNRGTMPQHEVTAAKMVAARFDGALLAVAGAGRMDVRFKRWDGLRWVEDVGETVANKAVDDFWHALRWALDILGMESERLIAKEMSAAGSMSEDQRNKLLMRLEKKYSGKLGPFEKFYTHLGAFAGRQAVKNLLGEVPLVLVQESALDATRGLLVVRNGVLDVKAHATAIQTPGNDAGGQLELLEHDPDRRLTQAAVNTSWVPGGVVGEVFSGYISGVLPDAEVRWHLQKALGSTLLGDPVSKMVISLVGEPDSGKSVLLDVLSSVLGDYVKWSAAQTFTQSTVKRKGSDPTPDLHRLRGSLIVLSSEPDPSSSWDSGLLKQISGRDALTTRGLYGRDMEWVPRFVLVLAANKHVRLSVDDPAMTQRITPIMFTRKFRRPGPGEGWESIPKEERADTELTRRIVESEAERSGVLAWLLAGLEGYAREGLVEPLKVYEARESMKRSLSFALEWLNDRLEEGVIVRDAEAPIWAKVGIADAHEDFRSWWIETQGFDQLKYMPAPLRFKKDLGLAANSRVGDTKAWRKSGSGPIERANAHVFDRLTWRTWIEAYKHLW